MGAAKISRVGFHAVTDDFAAAIGANRREPVNRAFKTIKNVTVSRRYYLKSQIIIVAANFALCHCFVSFFLIFILIHLQCFPLFRNASF